MSRTFDIDVNAPKAAFYFDMTSDGRMTNQESHLSSIIATILFGVSRQVFCADRHCYYDSDYLL